MNRAKIVVKRSDVASPTYRDTVVIGSNTYRVFQDKDEDITINGDSEIWILAIMRVERPRPMP